MLLAGLEADDIAGTDLLDRPALTLHSAKSRCHDQRLTEGMRMPGRARAGLERDRGALHAIGSGGIDQRVDAA